MIAKLFDILPTLTLQCKGQIGKSLYCNYISISSYYAERISTSQYLTTIFLHTQSYLGKQTHGN